MSSAIYASCRQVLRIRSITPAEFAVLVGSHFAKQMWSCYRRTCEAHLIWSSRKATTRALHGDVIPTDSRQKKKIKISRYISKGRAPRRTGGSRFQ